MRQYSKKNQFTYMLSYALNERVYPVIFEFCHYGPKTHFLLYVIGGVDLRFLYSIYYYPSSEGMLGKIIKNPLLLHCPPYPHEGLDFILMDAKPVILKIEVK